jgi:hypothetical protein
MVCAVGQAPIFGGGHTGGLSPKNLSSPQSDSKEVVVRASTDCSQTDRQSLPLLHRRPGAFLTLGDLHGHHDGDRIPRPAVRANRQQARIRRPRDFERLGLVAVADDLLPAGSRRPAARHVGLVGLRLVSGTQRRLRAKTHGCMHRRGDPRGRGAATVVRLIGQDQGLINLRPLRHALCEQHLDAAQPHRQAPVVPEGATNLGLIGQYVEVSQDIAFTIEYSARTAWEAVHLLLKRGPAPPRFFRRHAQGPNVRCRIR